jgi:hypothetical protein
MESECCISCNKVVRTRPYINLLDKSWITRHHTWYHMFILLNKKKYESLCLELLQFVLLILITPLHLHSASCHILVHVKSICISIYLMELIRALARMACKFQIPKSLTVLWFVIHILWFVAHIFWLFCGYTFTFSVKSMNYHHKRTSYFIFIQKNKQIIVCKTTLLLPKNNWTFIILYLVYRCTKIRIKRFPSYGANIKSYLCINSKYIYTVRFLNLIDRKTRAQDDEQEGLDPSSQMYKALVSNPNVQLGLNNPRCLLGNL